MEPRILGIGGPFQGQTLSLPEGEVSIGREPTNQMSVFDGSLSRHHCALARSGSEVRIRDLGSRNGTRVNSVPVTDQRLQHGDQISVGSSLFVFLQEDLSDEGRSNPVEFQDTSSFTSVAFLLPQEDPLSPLIQQGENAGPAAAPGRVRSDLNALLKIATAISSIRDRESLQWQLLGFIFDVIPAERGSVLFFDPQGDILSTTAWDRVRGPEHVVPVSQAVLKKVVTERSGMLVTGAGHAASAKSAPGSPENHATSLLCVPMIVGERVSGVIYLDAKVPTVQFDSNHLRVLQAIAHIA